MDYKNEFHEIHEKIGDYNSHPTDNLNEMFLCLIKASFVKCIEFNIFIQNENQSQNSFFYTPFLRGICEDFITLKYLKKHFITDRDELLGNYMQYLIYSSLEVQTAFFDKIVPEQISPKFKKGINPAKFYETELKKTMEKNGLNKNKIFPSVEHMSIDGGLKHLYDFFYHATSRMVHFSPNILLRMGWYKIDNNDNNDKMKPTIFSSHNFYKYYEQFNKFYAAFLFIQMSKTFKTELKLDNHFITIIKKMEEKITSDAFYPELVTFEELNQERPSNFFKILSKLINEKENR